MMALLERVRWWIRPPTMEDPDDLRLGKIVHTLALVMIGALFIPTLLRLPTVTLRPEFFIHSVVQALLALAFLLNRRGRVRTALQVMLFSLLAEVIFIVAVSDDGYHDVIMLALPGLLVVAGIMLDRTWFRIFAAATILLFVALTSAELVGLLSSDMSRHTTVFDLVEGSLILAITALAVGMLIRHQQSSFERVQASEAALALSNEQLRRQSQRLVESEARYRLVVESAQDPIVSTDINGRFVYVNGAAARMAGCAIEDMLGSDFFEFCLPEQRTIIRRGFFRQFHHRENNRSYEVALRSRKGKVHWLSINVSLELREGALSGFHVVARDITDRKKAEDEVRQLNQELERRVSDRTAKLEATMQELQRISYTVSHDLRAPLRHIGAYAEMSQTRPSVRDDAYARKYLQTIAFSAKWMGMLVDGLIEYLSIGQADLRRTNVNLRHLVDEVIAELAPDTSGRSITWRVGPLPVVAADRRLLRQALLNILGNAIKFTQPRTEAVVEIGCETEGLKGREHRIFVRDNGIGFDSRYQDRLFGLFERLHSRAENSGAGIGLANVRRIIHRHGGRVWAEGEVDRGVTITFTLPVLSDVTGIRPSAALDRSTSTGSAN
jgi:PAS domain S-box-containing protein